MPVAETPGGAHAGSFWRATWSAWSACRRTTAGSSPTTGAPCSPRSTCLQVQTAVSSQARGSPLTVAALAKPLLLWPGQPGADRVFATWIIVWCGWMRVRMHATVPYPVSRCSSTACSARAQAEAVLHVRLTSS